MWAKLKRQRDLCEDIVKTRNTSILSREVNTLEDIHKDITDTALDLHELLPRAEAEEMMARIEDEETSIFNIKNCFMDSNMPGSLIIIARRISSLFVEKRLLPLFHPRLL